MALYWHVERTMNERFPFRITISDDDGIRLAVRAQDKWPGPQGNVFCLREPRGSAADEPLTPVERVPVVSVQRMGRRVSVVLDRKTRKRCDFLFLKRAYKNRPGEYEQIYFRTQSGLRAHKTRNRLQIRGGGELSIAVDTQERYPWRFPKANVRREPLAAGDYALYVAERVVAVVERKSYENLLGDLGAVQVFHQQLADLAAYPRAAVVVEAQYADFLDTKRLQGRVSPTRLARALAELAALHPSVPVVYAGNRKLANQWVQAYFFAVAGSLADLPPQPVAEPSPRYAGEPERTDDAVRRAILETLPVEFRFRDLSVRFPDVADSRLRRVLSRLRAQGRIVTEGRGSGTRYRRPTEDESG